jgi:hypothetical protein
MRTPTLLVATAVSLLLAAASAQAQMGDIWQAGARVQVIAADQSEVWAVGAIVSVRGTARNLIRACGAEVDVDAVSRGDIFSCGAIVTLKGSAERDLFVIAARPSVDVRVGGNLKVFGARVVIGAQTQVTGEAVIGGADVVFAGTIAGPAEFLGDAVRIDGRITGPVRVRARSVTIGKNAVIDGAVVFETFADPTIEEGATVRGRQTVTQPQVPEVGPGQIFAALAGVFLFAIGAGLVLGIVLLIAARSFVERAIERMRTAPAQSALVGLAVLILVPVVAVVLMMTIVGIPVGLLILLAFPLTLFSAGVLAAFGLADWLMNRDRLPRSWGGRLLFLIVGLIVLVLIGLVPILGFITWVLALLIGLGALWQAMRTGPAAAAAG